MLKFKLLLFLLKMFGVEFTHISNNEIVFTCPCDVVEEEKAFLPQKQIIEDKNTACRWDEMPIHVEYSNGHLNWLAIDYKIGG